MALNDQGDDGPPGLQGRRGLTGLQGSTGGTGLRRTIIVSPNDSDENLYPPVGANRKGYRTSIVFCVNGFGTVLPTGVIGYLPIPFKCTIISWKLLANISGSVVIDIWKDTYANYPPTVADTITAAAKPTITTALKNTSSTLTGWTVSIAEDDILGFNVDSVTTITMLSIELDIIRNMSVV